MNAPLVTEGERRLAMLPGGCAKSTQGTRHLGVSVVICCHNSVKRLPATISHLAAQVVPPKLSWEVLIVDNASTDSTAETARECWPAGIAVELRVVREPRLGLTYARECAFREARFEIISFIDDDNWVCPQWVAAAFDVMSEHPEIGACGGFNEAVCDVPPPWWFEQFKGMLAISSDKWWRVGYLRGGETLIGAGMTIRRAAWDLVTETGYSLFVMGRQGKVLTSGEDHEICFALHLAGWRLWHDRRLRLQHFLPARRLNWRYVRGLYRGLGVSSTQLDAYYFLHSDQRPSWKNRLRRIWQWHFCAAAKTLLRNPWRLLTFWHSWEGDPVIANMEFQMGRLSGFLRDRSSYNARRRRVLELLLNLANRAAATGAAK
jgi:glycosyltransferase involved in cell wall biosynthesis